MRRWGWIFALLVSVGLNAGILATLWVTRAQSPPPPRPREAQGPLPPGRPGEPPPLAGAPPPERPPADPREGPPGEPQYGPPGRPMPPPQDHPPGQPGPEGPPPDDGPFGGESAEVGPEPGTVLPVPSTPPPRLREFADRLGISGEKRERFFALQLKMIATMRDGRWRIQRLRREVRVEMFSDRPDRTKIEANLAAIQNAQLALERQTVRTILETREILDGEAERQYLEFITRMRLGAGEPKPNGPRPRGMPGGRPGFDPRREPPGANPQNRPLDPGQNQPVPNQPGQDPRLNRPGGPPGGGFGGRPGGFGRQRPFPRGQRMLTPQERLERRRRFEEWQARQGTGQTAPPPQRSEPEGEAPPPT